MERRIKPFDELTLTDDFMFCKVFETNKELCKELIKLTVGDQIENFEYVMSQKSIKINEDSKGVRLDILIEDENGVIYNIEMQNVNNDNISKRARYYQGCLDQEMLEPGRKYSQLPKSIIVFICTFDPFGLGLPRYTFTERCEEIETLRLGDDTSKVFICATEKTSHENSSLGKFLNYLLNSKPTDGFTADLDEALGIGKQSAEWRRGYMTLERKLDEVRIVAREEGRQEGLVDLARRAIETNNDAALSLFSKEEIEKARAAIKG